MEVEPKPVDTLFGVWVLMNCINSDGTPYRLRGKVLDRSPPETQLMYIVYYAVVFCDGEVVRYTPKQLQKSLKSTRKHIKNPGKSKVIGWYPTVHETLR